MSWEVVIANTDITDTHLKRVRVPGGWLYCATETGPAYESGPALGLVFVPDPPKDERQ